MIDPWRIERACRRAWPALEELAVDGWIARLSGGDTRRPNSVNPAGPEAADPVGLIDRLRPRYAERDLPLQFRVPLFLAAADASLAGAGFVAEGRTSTLALALESGEARHLPSCPDARWLTARGDPAAAAIVGRLAIPAGFAAIERDGDIAAIGYAAIDDGLAVLESIRTLAPFRRRGAARECVAQLLDWAAGQGAHHVVLQVQADNAPAIALYRSLGFGEPLYDYHYRVAP